MSIQSTESIAPPLLPGVYPGDAIPQEVWEEATRRGVAQYLPQVIDLTREIYGGFTEISVSVDPEHPEDTHIVFHVPVHCSIEEALDKDLEWGRRLRQIIPRCPRVYIPSPDFRP